MATFKPGDRVWYIGQGWPAKSHTYVVLRIDESQPSNGTMVWTDDGWWCGPEHLRHIDPPTPFQKKLRAYVESELR